LSVKRSTFNRSRSARFRLYFPIIRVKRCSMRVSIGSVLGVLALAAALLPLIAYQDPAPRHVADPFAAGWMLADTNGDSIVDFIQGKIVVPANPAAEQNAAAA